MMGPRTGAQQGRIRGITLYEPLASFLDPTHRGSSQARELLRGSLRILLEQITEKSTISHPFFFH